MYTSFWAESKYLGKPLAKKEGQHKEVGPDAPWGSSVFQLQCKQLQMCKWEYQYLTLQEMVGGLEVRSNEALCLPGLAPPDWLQKGGTNT